MFPGDLQEVTESLNVTAERVGADYHFPLHVYTMIYESGFKAFFITLSLRSFFIQFSIYATVLAAKVI